MLNRLKQVACCAILFLLGLACEARAQRRIQIEAWQRESCSSDRLVRTGGAEIRHYNAQDQLTEINYFNFKPVWKRRSILTYNAQGRLETEKGYDPRGDSMLERQYVYRADGLPDTEYHYWLNRYPLATEYYTYTYDDSGRILTKNLTRTSGRGSEQSTYAYHHEDGNRITTVYCMRGSERKGVARRMICYGVGRLLREEDFTGAAEAYDYLYDAGSEWIIKRRHLRNRLKHWKLIVEYRRVF